MAVVRVHHYSVSETDVAEFLTRRASLVETMRADHPGLTSTRLIKLEDGGYTDIWQWDSMEQMGAAFAAAGSVSEIGPTMALTIDATAQNGEVVDER